MPTDDPGFYLSPERAGPFTSALFVYFFFLVVPLGLLLWALYRRHLNHKLAQNALLEPKVLVPGLTTLWGHLEPTQEPTTFSEQLASPEERQKKMTSTRTLEAPPFYLRLSSGKAIRVEPQGELFYTDEVTKTDKITFVSGELVEGSDPRAEEHEPGSYRDSPRSLVLRPPSGVPIGISTIPPSRKFLQKAEHYQKVALRCLYFLVLVHGFLLVGYHQRKFSGEIVYSNQLSLYSYRSNKKTAYGLRGFVEIDGGKLLYVDAQVGEGLLRLGEHPLASKTDSTLVKAPVPILVGDIFFKSYEVGIAATIDGGWLVLLSVFVVVGLCLFANSKLEDT